MDWPEIIIKGQTFVLHPHKAIFWKETKALLIADFHLGKGAHFRKNGIPVHAGIDQVNIKNLHLLIKKFLPERIIFLGDLFHSRRNGEWDTFKKFVEQFNHIHFDLVIGNHDILSTRDYNDLNLACHKTTLEQDQIVISHKPIEDWQGPEYNLAGHIHPAVQLKGMGRQYLKMPCFYFGLDQGIMPAFGNFTGQALLKPSKESRIYVPTGKKVLAF